MSQRSLATAARLVALCALLAPGVASAKNVVLVPLLPKGATNMQVANVTSLLMSELDFRPEFDKVVELEGNAGSPNCLASASCLGGLVGQGGGGALVTGSLSTSDTRFSLDLVYFDGGRIVRRKTFHLASDPVSVADGMNGVVYELLTGQTRQAAQEAEPAASDFDFSFDDEDDFSFDDGAASAEARRQEALAAERRRAEEEARRAEELRRAEEERRRREAEAAARAEEERRRAEERRLAEERRRQAEEAARRAREEQERAASSAEFDPSMISFGAVSEDDVTLERIEETIQFASPGASVSVERDEPSYDSSFDDLDAPASYDDSEDLDDLDLDTPSARVDRFDDLDADLDGPVRARPGPERSNRSTTRRDASDDGNAVNLRARAGYSRYYALDFVTYGVEAHVPVAAGLGFLAGVQGFSVNRQIPEEMWERLGRISEWNTIFPLNAGLLYQFGQGTVAPYLGADVVTAQYFVDPETSKGSWTFGARGRLGADIWVSDAVGLNIDAAIGGWHGPYWVAIQDGVQNTGALPQISGGLVVGF